MGGEQDRLSGDRIDTINIPGELVALLLRHCGNALKRHQPQPCLPRICIGFAQLSVAFGLLLLGSSMNRK
jgi:hypothetical protein